jgi:hypothetical protein
MFTISTSTFDHGSTMKKINITKSCRMKLVCTGKHSNLLVSRQTRALRHYKCTRRGMSPVLMLANAGEKRVTDGGRERS